MKRQIGILGEKENTIDVVIVGNSKAYNSIIPMELWKEYGFTSHICSTPWQTLPDSLTYVYKSMKKQNPKYIILEADNIFFDASVSRALSQVAFNVLPVTEYHNRWKHLNSNDFFGAVNYTWTDDLKGYEYTTLEGEGAENTDSYMDFSKEASKITETNKMYVKLLNEYCKLNDAKLIIISVPSKVHWNYKNHNGIKKFAEEENIEFLDLNLLKNKINIDWDKDIADNGEHLNYYGALKVTEYLGNYLSEKSTLEDHRLDQRYKKWNEALKRYEECACVDN